MIQKLRFLIQTRLGLLVICLFACLCLTACGQSGPLYLPDQKPPIKTACPTCP